MALNRMKTLWPAVGLLVCIGGLLEGATKTHVYEIVDVNFWE